ncbi:MAG: hypothetical protein ABR608_13260 [Pseudonocardiaceae bacterium]
MSFVAAGVAGVLGGHLTKDAVGAAVVLAFGALGTGWAALRAPGSGDAAGPGGGPQHVGTVTVRDVSGGKGSQVAGVNYGSMTQTNRTEDP